MALAADINVKGVPINLAQLGQGLIGARRGCFSRAQGHAPMRRGEGRPGSRLPATFHFLFHNGQDSSAKQAIEREGPSVRSQISWKLCVMTTTRRQDPTDTASAERVSVNPDFSKAKIISINRNQDAPGGKGLAKSGGGVILSRAKHE